MNNCKNCGSNKFVNNICVYCGTEGVEDRPQEKTVLEYKPAHIETKFLDKLLRIKLDFQTHPQKCCNWSRTLPIGSSKIDHYHGFIEHLYKMADSFSNSYKEVFILLGMSCFNVLILTGRLTSTDSGKHFLDDRLSVIFSDDIGKNDFFVCPALPSNEPDFTAYTEYGEIVIV